MGLNIHKYHKIRKIVTNTKYGDVYGITIPEPFVEELKTEVVELKFQITRSGNSLLLTPSGIYEKKKDE